MREVPGDLYAADTLQAKLSEDKQTATAEQPVSAQTLEARGGRGRFNDPTLLQIAADTIYELCRKGRAENVYGMQTEATVMTPSYCRRLPATGANWLAVVGTALSGMFLLAAGFVLDRKNHRMNWNHF